MYEALREYYSGLGEDPTWGNPLREGATEDGQADGEAALRSAQARRLINRRTINPTPILKSCVRWFSRKRCETFPPKKMREKIARAVAGEGKTTFRKSTLHAI